MRRTFVELFRAAMNDVDARPYPYQERLAAEGLPELLRVPTGAGKTAAGVLPWLWRRLEHPDTAVRAGEARWLVFVLPLRSLVEQTAAVVREWTANAGLAGAVGVHVFMGGEGRDDDAWRMDPSRTAVFVGTQDMLLSRLLMRGYGESRAQWPVSFGLLHNGVQFVFDETQLMGPGLPTSAQLQGLREKLGTGAPSRSMWMSATLAPQEVCTPDHREVRGVVELGEDDRVGSLAVRLNAVRQVERVEVPELAAAYPAGVAQVLVARHVPGTRTIAVFNTVERAVAVQAALAKLVRRGGPEVVLLHSRFRPPEREGLMDELKAPLSAAGQIVISTQVLEAGVDLSSRVLFTEAALFSSVVQRAGRCNRAGEFPEGANLLWATPPSGRGQYAPYEQEDVETAVEALTSLEGTWVTSTRLQEMPVVSKPVVHPVLRRRDLLQLFDTMPDLSGADIDVSQWIRDGQDTTALVAWRDLADGRPGERETFPAREELCPAPIRDLKTIVKDSLGPLWVLDAAEGTWRRAQFTDIQPGAVLLTSTASGWYDSKLGWGLKHRGPVTSRVRTGRVPDGMSKDDASCVDRWVDLIEHLEDVEREVGLLAGSLAPLDGLSAGHLEAARLAGRYHDLGKAHSVFANTIRRSCPEGEQPPGEGPWAKSRHQMGRHERKYFRHELISALTLLHPDSTLLAGNEYSDLIAYLAAAHHGKVRVSVRSMPGEAERVPPRVLGVEPAEEVGPVELPGGKVLPRIVVDPSVLFLGGGPQEAPSWTQRTSQLLSQLGPFRLALLEALVRVADWRASQAYRTPQIAQDQAIAPDEQPSAAPLPIPAPAGAFEQEVLW
ncbi:DEAD/DEAH box helicase [Streptomyces sp. NPDC007904]|uniref:type I-G CRISPR-associated helicase/endonuclease Cas3g n=1 Tax=Streptomyces sp. NPDC007904 TaxID=3364787 RepID=UPI0036EC1CC0